MKDIIVKKSIHDVTPSHEGMSRIPQGIRERAKNTEDPFRENRIESNPFFEKGWTKNTEQHTFRETKKGKGVGTILWILVVILFLSVGFFVLDYFSSATITVEPITRKVTIDKDLVANKDEALNTLVFKSMSTTEELSKEIPATLEKKVQKKASGKVIIYNTYSAQSQRLIKNTRLETPDHKIFRIDESVVVPGAKIVKGKSLEPGTTEALIYADIPGEEYNIGLADFTIPGFKGDPRYTKFTARSKPGAPLVGGFSGAVKVPSDEEITRAEDELKQNLKTTAIEKARAEVPSGVSFFPGSMVLTFEQVPQELGAKDTTKVSVRATVVVFFFDTAHFIEKFAKEAVGDYQGNTYATPDMSALSFSFVDPVDTMVLANINQIRFHLAGEVLFVGAVDKQKITEALSGKEKKDFGKLIAGEDNVAKAEAVIRPMWKTVFPNDPAKITVNVLVK